MPTITLDQIRTDLDAAYGPLVIPFGDGLRVTFVQALRLPKEQRKKVLELQREQSRKQEQRDAEEKRIKDAGGEPPERDLDETETEQLAFMRSMLALAATDPDACDLFLDEVGDDVLLLSRVIEAWTKDSQSGEASTSAS